jgi:hypothetical protein
MSTIDHVPQQDLPFLEQACAEREVPKSSQSIDILSIINDSAAKWSL